MGCWARLEYSAPDGAGWLKTYIRFEVEKIEVLEALRQANG
ncbi:hypothetical protein [Calidithermus roseus]|nr:hypothetical protein [Calidithermus roseus]